ncbi:MAG: FHA domain-containing protein [Gemmatimonadetes bacterium]|nr:FHA domain-containing protein [Gemmatimonadota bacterium]
MADSASRGTAVQVQIAGEPEREFDDSFTIGRGPENDIVFDDDLVSTRHVEVVLTDGKWQIQDLGSTNGTLIGGRRIERVPLRGPVEIRLAHNNGPTLRLTPFDVGHKPGAEPRDTAVPSLSDSRIVDRYFGDETPVNMSDRTAMMRRVVKQQQRKQSKKYRIALGVLAVVAVAIAGFAYRQRHEVEQQRATAADLFYKTKALELEVRRLQLSAGDRASYRELRAELEQQYQDFVEALGIYSDDTSEEVRLIYRITHRFGESEVNVPPEFVDEVLQYIERWQRSGDLSTIIARASRNDYGRRIAEIMLEHGLPPEFFYLALQESAFRVDAVGPPTNSGFAKGMWQFIPTTARNYRLQIGPLIAQPRPDPLDERHDFEKSTRAAARYLRDLYTTDAQASGLLVIASYNWGETRVLRLIHQMEESPRERNFWNLLSLHRDRIPQETYDYVYRIVAAAVIGENPGLFGFDFEPPLPPVGRAATRVESESEALAVLK